MYNTVLPDKELDFSITYIIIWRYKIVTAFSFDDGYELMTTLDKGPEEQ